MQRPTAPGGSGPSGLGRATKSRTSPGQCHCPCHSEYRATARPGPGRAASSGFAETGSTQSPTCPQSQWAEFGRLCTYAAEHGAQFMVLPQAWLPQPQEDNVPMHWKQAETSMWGPWSADEQGMGDAVEGGTKPPRTGLKCLPIPASTRLDETSTPSIWHRGQDFEVTASPEVGRCSRRRHVNCKVP